MMFKSALRELAGPVKANETTGVLFEEGGEIKFGYRLGTEEICVDRFGFWDKLFLRRDYKRMCLEGYDLLGRPVDGYGRLQTEIPQLPSIDRDVTEEDVEIYDGSVVVYKGSLAVVFNRGIMYVEEAPRSILGELGRHVEYDGNGICLVQFWGGPLAIENKGPNLGAFMGDECERILKRNGINADIYS